MPRRWTNPPSDDISTPGIIFMAGVVAILLAWFALQDLWHINRGRR